ncbi:UNVERIFIED_CONTAM: hypothetical protein Slati_3394700 [Sesamum latifolium]|uniref:Uncharacterized protein n=1 Tax=Sesamum latifolium TaxID=2727402 RepID=A0AAW2UFT2_9LAMI
MLFLPWRSFIHPHLDGMPPGVLGDISGLVVNTSKSSIFTVGIVNNELDAILARTEFSRGEMHVRYLGIPLQPASIGHRPLAASGLDCKLHFQVDGQVPFLCRPIGTHQLSYPRASSVFWLQCFPLPRQLSIRYTDFIGISFGTLREHRCLGEICHPKKGVGLGSGNSILECGSPCRVLVEHSPQGKYVVGEMGQ